MTLNIVMQALPFAVSRRGCQNAATGILERLRGALAYGLESGRLPMGVA